MSDKITGLNGIIPNHGSAPVKKTATDNTNAFAKLLGEAISKTDSPATEKAGNINGVLPTSYINPLQRIENNTQAADYVEKNLDNVISQLELFSKLLGDNSVSPEDISPLAGRIKEDMNEILRYSEKNNIPMELKNLAKESSALAYAAVEKMNLYM